jgi:hypothetical protein
MVDIRPKLRHLAPQTYWLSVSFALFNISIGTAVLDGLILYKIQLLGAIPMKAWGLIFLFHGFLMLASLLFNDWKSTRALHLIGVIMKSTWLFEALAATMAGQSAFPLFVWAFLDTIQIVVYLYFTPRLDRAK